MRVRSAIAAMSLIGALSIGLVETAAAQSFVLPTPENNPNASYGVYPDATGASRQAILMDGIPIAFKYDDFWSYSAKILESIQTVSPTLIPSSTFGTYDFSTGTGVIIANITSVAGGATNDGGLQDPVNLSGGGTGVSGWVCQWGDTTQACNTYVYGATNSDPPVLDPARSYTDSAANQGTTTTVGELLALLQSLDPEWTIPLLYADYNQTGGGDSLFASLRVQIYDGTTLVKEWDLDSITNTAWDETAPTYNFGDITFTDAVNCAAIGAWDPITGEGCAGVTTSGATYTGSHNKGSGKADFMAFAPDMDLTLYDSAFVFKVSINLGCNLEGVENGLIDPSGPTQTTQGCNTDGYEEFGILGGVGPIITVPEPGSLALLGIGLAGSALVRRRRINA